MKKIPQFVWLLVGLVAVATSLYCGGRIAWDTVYPSGTLRYKMTVSVETPEGIKTGSAVREIYFYRTPQLVPDASPWIAGVSKGEAVVVDLGKRGVLFALMRGLVGRDTDYGHDIIPNAFPPPDAANDISCCHFTKEGVRYYRTLKIGFTTLDIKEYPEFVRFRDLKDPKTVENVLDMGKIDEHGNYTIKADHFEEMFGKGVKLKEITIEVTDAPVTTGIDKYLQWLDGVTANIDGTQFTSWRIQLASAPRGRDHEAVRNT
jgi:hypothetical protein